MIVIAPGIVALFALMPALVVGLLVPASIRSPQWSLITGILVGLGGLCIYYAVMRWADSPMNPAPLLDFSDPKVAHIVMVVVSAVVVSGGCAGLTFWAIAGRNALVRRLANDEALL